MTDPYVRWISLVLLLLLLACRLNDSAMSFRSYNDVNLKHYESFDDFALKYLDDNGLVIPDEYLLLGIATDDCIDLLYSPLFRAVKKHVSILRPISILHEDFPVQIDSCAELLYYKPGTSIHRPTGRTIDMTPYGLEELIRNYMASRTTLNNQYSDRTLAIHLVHENHKEDLVDFLTPNREGVEYAGVLGTMLKICVVPQKYFTLSEDEQTYTLRVNEYKEFLDGHILDFFPIEDVAVNLNPRSFVERYPSQWPQYQYSNCNITITADAEGNTVHYRQCANYDEVEALPLPSTEDIQSFWIEWSHVHFWAVRLAMNYVQPQQVRSVTEEGFLIRPLPQSTMEWLTRVNSEKPFGQSVERKNGPIINQEKAMTAMTHLDQSHRDRLHNELHSLFEEWYGGQLRLTSIYGIRRYHNGSILRMHVDTVQTHVVSAIINIDQDLNEDWPLLILDHAGREHNVSMEKGDMLFYESAKLLHGRPTSMNGNYYDNIFIHYQPLRGWDRDDLVHR